jgi:hypothetical protein
LIFCTVVRSPTARSEEATAAIANGSARLSAKVGQPELRNGNWTMLSAVTRISAVDTKPSPKARM